MIIGRHPGRVSTAQWPFGHLRRARGARPGGGRLRRPVGEPADDHTVVPSSDDHPRVFAVQAPFVRGDKVEVEA